MDEKEGNLGYEIYGIKYLDKCIRVLLLDDLKDDELALYNNIDLSGLKIYSDKGEFLADTDEPLMYIVITKDYNKNLRLLNEISKLNIFTMLITCNVRNTTLFDSFISYDDNNKMISDSINIIKIVTRISMIPGIICVDFIDLKTVLEKNEKNYYKSYCVPIASLEDFCFESVIPNPKTCIVEFIGNNPSIIDVAKIMPKLRKQLKKAKHSIITCNHDGEMSKSDMEINLIFS
jgi:hypothetical protein